MRDPYGIVIHPYITEKAMMLIEKNNSLEFLVKMDANKKEIKEAVQKLFDVKVEEVNTKIGKKGKIAIVKFSPEYEAEEIGMRIGVF
jgi:large subunit ribosomal protein L23